MNYRLTQGWPQHIESGAFVDPDTNPAYLAWLEEGNTPEPVEAPAPALLIDAKKQAVRAVREQVLDRLAGIAGRASRRGEAALAEACDTAAGALLDITKDLPDTPGAVEAVLFARYQAIALTAIGAAPSLATAFAQVDA